jgi:hypothetical protein
LAVTVDASHTLLKPHGVPRDVVVDHEPAELKVDSLAGSFGGDQHLSVLAKLTFCVNTAAGRITVADLHASMDLRRLEVPLPQLAEWAAILLVAGECPPSALIGQNQRGEERRISGSS